MIPNNNNSGSEASLLDVDLEANFDFEMDSKPPEKGGTTLCGKLGRKHRMKRQGPMKTSCCYPGCDGVC